jgi:urease accessory protein
VIRALRVVAGADYGSSPDDHIALDFGSRHRRRIRMTSASGKRFLLDLQAAVALNDNDVLELDDGSAVLVRAKVERVAEITADSPIHLTRVAWHLGNRHLPVQILDDRLRILYDHVIVAMVAGLGASVDVSDAPFQAEGGAYGHAHDH